MTKSTITREQLIKKAQEQIEFCRHTKITGEGRAHVNQCAALFEIALAAMNGEPVAEVVSIYGDPEAFGEREIRPLVGIQQMPYGTKLYRHAQPAPVVPENCVMAEHRRVIEMLLNVCGAAFELADDSCQQDVDGEDCHVVPDDAFQKLSDALDEIENTLPTEDIDRPDVFLAWSAMPRAALKFLLQGGNSPVIPDGSVIGWIRTDYQQDFQANCTAPQFIMGANDPSDAWGVKYMPVAKAGGQQNAPQNIPEIIPGWIPVSEQMPPSRHEVLVGRWWGEKPRWCCKWATYIPGHPDAQSSGWLLPGASWTPTHWMELPDAPQEAINALIPLVSRNEQEVK